VIHGDRRPERTEREGKLLASTQSYEGACHCGAVGILYQTALMPAEWPIRACQCGFCRAHGALSTSDPKGALQFVEHAPGMLGRYRFGHKTADFLLCRNCGVYAGAVIESRGKRFGILNARALLLLSGQLRDAEPMSYEDEEPAGRSARRERRWTPIASGEDGTGVS
jgi:hypothetical protein